MIRSPDAPRVLREIQEHPLLYPMPNEPRDSCRIEGRPLATLGGVEILPEVDADWKPIPDRWVLPGGLFVNTQQLGVIAALTGRDLVLTKE